MTNDEFIYGEWIEVVREEQGIVREDASSQQRAVLYNLEERTAKFAEAVIDFLKQVPLGPRTDRLVDQLTGCATSIGANYCEANDAVSHKEFIKIIGTCRKEARESKFFLRLVARACPHLIPAARELWQEGCQLHLIFSRIRRTAQKTALSK